MMNIFLINPNVILYHDFHKIFINIGSITNIKAVIVRVEYTSSINAMSTTLNAKLCE